MSPVVILWPVGALAMLTFAVLLVVPLRRFRAAFARRVTAEDFRYGESANVPGEVSIPTRNYMNLLESPTLFYVACVVFYVTDLVDTPAVAMAWLYVGHQMMFFAMSITVLVALWIHLLVSLLAA